MLDELEWPSQDDRRLKSSLTFFYNIHSGTVSLDKDRYLTQAPNLRSTRASHVSQYTSYMAYSDDLKNYIFPRTIPLWNSLPSSMVSSKGTSRQRSGKGAIRKRFPLQKPRWEKTKPTIRYLYHETYRKPNEQLFSQ